MTEPEIVSDLSRNLSDKDNNYLTSNYSDTINNIADEIDSLSNDSSETLSSQKDEKLLQTSTSETKTFENIQNIGETSGDSGISSSNSKESSPEDDWLDIMGSGNFKKLTLKKGLGLETRPDRGDKVTVCIEYFCNGTSIEKHENLQFIIGDIDVIQAIDLVVCLMEKEEIAKVQIPAKLAYGKSGRTPDIPPESDLECEIHLKDVQPLDLDKLTVSDRLQLGDEKRARGNFFFERAEYLEAIHCYERAIDYLEGIKDSSGSSTKESQKVVDMKIKVYNNLAASHLKLSAYQAALKSVESVLSVQPKNIKALFRKAKILGAQGSTDEAITCLKYASSLEPETKVFQTELIKLRTKKKKDEEAQKAMYRRMFPQKEPEKPKSSYKVMTLSAVTAAIMAVAGGMAAYRYLHS